MQRPSQHTPGREPDPRDEAPTVTSPIQGRGSAAPMPSSPSTRKSQYSNAFSAGDLIAGRYRIVAPLGKGGMGEVFRADDLELGSSVALKFLPLALSADPVRLEHFRSEVRLTRQIAHPAVCRVYDIAQVDTPDGPRHFLSMEFIDGEDLSSLIRRIGRLPADKAIQTARQICFGLAAAHELGVVHRDLKPANIMLDGRGNARVMDFGVAGFADDLNARGDIASGTPEYMAPEQLDSREITRRSDIYALGLVLFELFTGKPAFKASTLAELREARSHGLPASRPSTLVPDLDPAVERVIMRCLDPDPAGRPPSAVAVAAALPGGDPIAAALAAGETPSPELIAASGGSAIISSRHAIMAVAALLISALVIVFGARSTSLLAIVRPAKSVEVLSDRAREILTQLKLQLTSVNEAAHLGQRPKGWLTAENVRTFPGAYGFWYRQSPSPFKPWRYPLLVQDSDPAPSTPGEVIVRTDDRGVLEGMLVVPPMRADPPKDARPSEEIYRQLFALAQLDFPAFTSVPPEVRPLFHTDEVRSWTGPDPRRPGQTLTVHAAITDSRPTYFYIRYPFSISPAGWPTTPPPEKPLSAILASNAMSVTLIAISASMAFLAYRNLRAGRGDKRAATVGAFAVIFFTLLDLTSRIDLAPNLVSIFFEGTGFGVVIWTAMLFWLFYIALEPAARRNYPWALVSWSRLVRGQISDSLVARDLLIGLVGGACIESILLFSTSILRQRGMLGDQPWTMGVTRVYLDSWGGVLGHIGSAGIAGMLNAAGALLLMVVGRLIFRTNLAGAAFAWVCIALAQAPNFATDPISATLEIVVAFLLIFCMYRFSLLTAATFVATATLIDLLNIGPSWTGFGAPAWLPALLLSSLAFWAIRCGMRPSKSLTS